MTGFLDLTCRPVTRIVLCVLAGLAPVGVCLIVLRLTYRGEPVDPWVGLGLLLVLVGVVALDGAVGRVRADTCGLHFRALLRRRSVPWKDVAELRLHRFPAGRHDEAEGRGVSVRLRDGRRLSLPQPYSALAADDGVFDAQLAALQDLFRRHGNPESDRIPVITHRSAGYGVIGSALVCVVLLGCAGIFAMLVPGIAAERRAWEAAVACTAEQRVECLSTAQAVIARTKVGEHKEPSWLYFADGRPFERTEVSREAAGAFRSGDPVTLTLWRGEVQEVVGKRYVWHEEVPEPGVTAALGAALTLAAGYPAARVVLRRRDRWLPDDEVLPSAAPFAGALAGTALWLLPLCYLHPTTLFSSPVALSWAGAGSLVTLGLFSWAWRASRVRAVGGAVQPAVAEEDGEVFVAARFLEHTDYNPYGFGTHIVLGGGPPAVTPHGGPGRFAARRVPVERLTVREVRRARGEDGDTVPRDWHVAELDDGGRLVRLAAPPAQLTRVLGLLQRS